MHIVSSFIFTWFLSVCAAWTINKVLLSASHVDHGNFTSTGSIGRRAASRYSHIIKGLSVAIAECQRQFQWDPWNCPVSLSSVLSRSYMNNVNREIAFLQAITSAGITYQVTKKCHEKGGRYCPCGKIEDKYHASDTPFKCSANVQFGERVSAAFLRSYTDTDFVRRAVKRHNEQVGNEYVRQTQRIRCKCHGPTAGCTLKTCWRQLGQFSKIADILKKKYKRAKYLLGVRKSVQGRSNHVSKPRLNKVSKRGLIYLETSPDYCVQDTSLGHPGTRGRECKRVERGSHKSVQKWERNNCRRLCSKCGHKVRKTMTVETEKCNCQFVWCCTVKCSHCVNNVTRHYCT